MIMYRTGASLSRVPTLMLVTSAEAASILLRQCATRLRVQRCDKLWIELQGAIGGKLALQVLGKHIREPLAHWLKGDERQRTGNNTADDGNGLGNGLFNRFFLIF